MCGSASLCKNLNAFPIRVNIFQKTIAVELELRSTHAQDMPATASPQTSSSRLPFHPRLAFALAAILLIMLPVLANVRPLSAQSINDQPPARVVSSPPPKIDINRASIAELMRAPGITQAYAQRIVAGRPYVNKTQLTTLSILPPQVYEAAKERLIAHHMSSASTRPKSP